MNRIAIVVVLVMIVAFSSLPRSSGAPTQSPSTPNLKLIRVVVTCPGGYLSSPEGCIPKECSFRSVTDVDTTTGVVRFLNGSRTLVPKHCQTGSPLATNVSVYSDGSTTSSTISRQSSNSSAPFPTNGWVEDTHYSNWPWSSFSSFTGNWGVPRGPTNNNGQTIFLFIGLEDLFGSVIIQPVLQWGGSCAGGGAFWSIASWYVWGSGCASANWSQLNGVNVGDNIAGSMQLTGLCGHSCLVWTITARDTNTGAATTLTVNTGIMWNAFATLETYGVVNCGDYPADGQAYFSNLNINGGTPGWGAEIKQNDGCQENVVIISQGNPSAVALLWQGVPPPCGCCCGGSVAAGTLITLADRTQVPVQNLQVGTHLLAYDLTTNQYVDTTITRMVTVVTHNQMVISTGTGKPLIVDQNPAQKLDVKLPDGTITLMPVTDLKAGYALFDVQNWTPITGIHYENSGTHIMYDIYDTTPSNYIANGYLVQDK